MRFGNSIRAISTLSPDIIFALALFSSLSKGPNSGLALTNNALSAVNPDFMLLAISCSASGSMRSTNLPFPSAAMLSQRYVHNMIKPRQAENPIQSGILKNNARLNAIPKLRASE